MTNDPTHDTETLRAALLLACRRIADGPQEYHEANTPEGWASVFIKAAEMGMTTDEVLAGMPVARKMGEVMGGTKD